MRKPTTACARGPKPPGGVPAGQSAAVAAPQPAQTSVWRRYSVTTGCTRGTSLT